MMDFFHVFIQVHSKNRGNDFWGVWIIGIGCASFRNVNISLNNIGQFFLIPVGDDTSPLFDGMHPLSLEVWNTPSLSRLVIDSPTSIFNSVIQERILYKQEPKRMNKYGLNL